MKESLPWFKCVPSKLLGALAGMLPDEGYLYTVVLLRIYEVGGPIADSAKVLARRTGMTERRASIALESLCEMGKLTILDGRIDSPTTHEILNDREKCISDAKNAGKESGKKRIEKSKLNQQKSPMGVENKPTVAQRPANYLDLDKEKKKKSSSVEKSFEAKCREAVGEEPVLTDPKFYKLVDGLVDGLTEDDALAGISAAMAEPSFRIKYWSQLIGWARTAAKNRLADKPKINGSHAEHSEKTYDLGAGVEITEVNLTAAIMKPNAYWREKFFGSDAAFKHAVQMQAPHLMPMF
jgi:hypothetical protein